MSNRFSADVCPSVLLPCFRVSSQVTSILQAHADKSPQKRDPCIHWVADFQGTKPCGHRSMPQQNRGQVSHFEVHFSQPSPPKTKNAGSDSVNIPGRP